MFESSLPRRWHAASCERWFVLLCLIVVSGCGADDGHPPPFDDGASGGAVSDGGSGGSGTPTGGSASSGGSGPSGSGGEGTQSGGSGGVASGGSASGGGDGSGGEPPSCTAESCLFAWPLSGSAAKEWVIANYMDRTPGTGVLDYHGGTRTYEGHQGVDIAIASFRVMDQGVVAHAVAPGVVSALHDGEADRNTVADPGSCSLLANSVYVTHPDGLEGRYLHFRKGSIKVTVGQEIQAGDELGLVGSSGCSQSPHLHFELRDPQNGNAVLDPFFEDRWAAPPAYDVAPGVMEVVLQSGSFSSVNDVQLAPPSPTSFASGTLGLSVITGGTTQAETLGVRLYQGNALQNTFSYQYVGDEDLYMRWWNPSLSAGSWRADITIGDQVVDSVAFQVN